MAVPENHDCGYPPGDEMGPGFMDRQCSECGTVWHCIHPRLGWWVEQEADHGDLADAK